MVHSPCFFEKAKPIMCVSAYEFSLWMAFSPGCESALYSGQSETVRLNCLHNTQDEGFKLRRKKTQTEISSHRSQSLFITR